jgi:aromatase
MTSFTIEDLRCLLRETPGAPEAIDGGCGGTEASYADLGYDSLALMEVAARIKQRHGVEVPQDAVATTATPAMTVVAVEQLVSGGNGTRNGTGGHVDNRVLIHAPIDLVWTVTNDVAGWPWLFTEYASAEILQTAENYVRFRLTTHPVDGQRWSWVSERRLDPVKRVVSARRVEPGAFEFMNIRWEYRNVGGAVEMRWLQDFKMLPTAPVGDAEMTDRINRNTVVQMARIKHLLETGATNPEHRS